MIFTTPVLVEAIPAPVQVFQEAPAQQAIEEPHEEGREAADRQEAEGAEAVDGTDSVRSGPREATPELERLPLPVAGPYIPPVWVRGAPETLPAIGDTPSGQPAIEQPEAIISASAPQRQCSRSFRARIARKVDAFPRTQSGAEGRSPRYDGGDQYYSVRFQSGSTPNHAQR